MNRRGILLLLLGLVIAEIVQGKNVTNPEQKIWDRISGSNPGKFFPGSLKSPITLQVHLALVSLSDYEHVVGTMRVGYWFNMQWTIPSLSWNPSEHGGISKIHVRSEDLWTPDIVQYRHLNTEKITDERIIVYSNGMCIWVPHLTSTVLCENVKNGPGFPRDQKVCRLKFGSWVYPGNLLNMIITNYGDIKKKTIEYLDANPLESSGWKFLHATQDWKNMTYPCCPETYPSVHVNVTIERKDNYYSMAISVPGAVTGLLVAFFYLLFPTSSARIICQTICLLIFVFVAVSDLRLMGDSIDMAPAAHFYIAGMILNLFAIFWSILVAAIWKQSELKGHANEPVSPLVSRLECICLLPGAVMEVQSHELSEDEQDNIVYRGPSLSNNQRFCLAVDRLFSLITIILLVFLFGYLGS